MSLQLHEHVRAAAETRTWRAWSRPAVASSAGDGGRRSRRRSTAGRRVRAGGVSPDSAAYGPEQPLREWLEANGGVFHPALRLVDAAPCGARGVVAVRPIPLAELDAAGPLIVVPKALHLENTAAVAMLERWAGADAARDAVREVRSALLVAAALLHEAALGGASAWAPYVASLPAAPPSPWLLDGDDELERAAAAVLRGAPPCQQEQRGESSSSSSGGPGSEGPAAAPSVEAWVAAAREYRAAVEAEVAHACELLASAAARSEASKLLGGGSGGSGGGCAAAWLEPARLAWALAQVESRSLGTAGSSGLVPVVDLLNHAADARPPMLQLDDADRLVVTALPLRASGDAVELGAGGELVISYGERRDPLQAWLKFGFVSAEWWRGDDGDDEGGV